MSFQLRGGAWLYFQMCSSVYITWYKTKSRQDKKKKKISKEIRGELTDNPELPIVSPVGNGTVMYRWRSVSYLATLRCAYCTCVASFLFISRCQVSLLSEARRMTHTPPHRRRGPTLSPSLPSSTDANGTVYMQANVAKML